MYPGGLSRPGTEAGHQEPGGRYLGHMRGGRSREADPAQDVEHGPGESAQAAQQRGNRGDHPAAPGDQQRDRRIRHRQAAEREHRQRTRQVQLGRVGRRDGQELERGGRIGDHLVGAPGVQRLGTDVKRGGDGQEGGQQPQACPGSVIHGLVKAAEMAGPLTAEEEPADRGGSGRRSRDSGAGRSAHVRFLWLSRPAGRRGSRFVPGRSKNASSSDGFFSMCRSWNEACAAGLRRHCRGAEAHGQGGREADRPSAGRLAVRWDRVSVARIPVAGYGVSDVPMKATRTSPGAPGTGNCVTATQPG